MGSHQIRLFVQRSTREVMRLGKRADIRFQLRQLAQRFGIAGFSGQQLAQHLLGLVKAALPAQS